MKRIVLQCCFLGTALLNAACGSDASDKTTALSAPEHLISENNTPESFDLRWEPVEHAVSYVYQVIDFSMDTKPIVLENTTDTQASVSGLRPETQYSIGVKAIGDGRTWGDSPWCSTNAETLPAKIPDYTFDVKEPTPDSFCIIVYPTVVYPDPINIGYYVGWMEQTEWTGYLASDGTLDTKALQEAVRSRLEKEAEKYGSTYLKELQFYTYKSSMELEVSSLTPGTGYVVYAFGCDRENGTFFDNVCFTVVTTPYRLPN